MVTGMHEARYALAKVAINCFRAQTYPERELLIINHGNNSLFTGEKSIVEVRIRKGENDTVGDLRNLALKHASGDLVINWDDDDWHGPERMSMQFAAYGDKCAVVLKNQIRFNLVNNSAFCFRINKGLAGTILHSRDVAFRYPSFVRGSDTAFMHAFGKSRVVLDNDPAVYIRFYHGLNLWDARHIMHRLAGSDVHDQIDLSSGQREVLKDALERNYEEYALFRKLSCPI